MSLLITPADSWYSKCVRERAEWRCEYPGCGVHYPPPTQALHCAHIMSRGHWSVRFDPSNATALCYGHHRYTEQNRESAFLPMVKAIFGEAEWDRVYSEAYKPNHRIRKRVKDIAAHYKAEYSRMQAMRADGVIGRIEFQAWEG